MEDCTRKVMSEEARLRSDMSAKKYRMLLSNVFWGTKSSLYVTCTLVDVLFYSHSRFQSVHRIFHELARKHDKLHKMQ
jgi:hypothetical protein